MTVATGNKKNSSIFVHQFHSTILKMLEEFRAQGNDVAINIARIHGTKDLKTEKVPERFCLWPQYHCRPQ